jgi:hypothetical protein
MSLYKPYHLLLLAGLSLLVCALFSTNESINVHVHDTYVVMTHSFFYGTFAVLSFLFWSIYILTRRLLLSNLLTWLHVVLTLLAMALFICIPLFSYPRRYVDVTPWSGFNEFHRTNEIVVGSTIIFTVAQLMLVVNIVGGLFRRARRR